MRALLLLALLASACSYGEESAQIFVRVDNVPAAADRLVVVLTPSDTTVAGKNCPTTVTAASNAICYQPSFQPGALNTNGLDLAFAQPSAAGAVTFDITAEDRAQSALAHGLLACTLPCPLNLQVTLH